MRTAHCLSFFIVLLLLLHVCVESVPAQAVSASVVSQSPPQLRLEWDVVDYFGTAMDRKLFRRNKEDLEWGAPIATLPNSGTTYTYTDTTLTAGVAYEYRLQTVRVSDQSLHSESYVSGGIDIPVIENRGTLLLLVDQSQASALAPELATLMQDLVGDGWTVQRTDLPRATIEAAEAFSPSLGSTRLAEARAVKDVIVSACNVASANVKAVYIIGHLPVPYSGDTAPDQHPDHRGAWPADTYYGDIDGTWTDETVTATGATDPRNRNVPGDGKFDQSEIPSSLELSVGRVDFANMTVFPSSAVTETELLRRYLRKASDYRHRRGAYSAIERRAVTINAFSGANQPSMASSIAAVLGRSSTVTDVLAPYTGSRSPWFDWMERNPTKTYLIGSSQTSGQSDGNAAGNSVDFGSRPSRSVFNVLFGSYLGDFEYPNNFMRASLAGNASGDSLGLTCFWAGRPNLFLQSMALGETIGYSARVSQNDDGSTIYDGSTNKRGIHTALMGDPSLRLFSVLPPQNLQAASNLGAVRLSWDASTEGALTGYLVYRASDSNGPYTRLTASPIIENEFTDSAVTVGEAYTYMVKTVKRESTPAGTFFNTSVGQFATILASSASTSIPLAPFGLHVSALNSTTLNLAWSNHVTDETAYRVERRSSPTGPWEMLATLPADSTSHTDAGPLTRGATLSYRVISINGGGESLPSQEVSLSGHPGSIGFLRSTTHVERAPGLNFVDVPVHRIGGSVGTVSVNYATSDAGTSDFPRPGIDYVQTSGTLTFADGEVSKTVRVTLLNSSPQPPQSFLLTLSSPTGGAGLTTTSGLGGTRVLVKDASAPLPSPWQETIIGNSNDPGATGAVAGTISSSFWGGLWNGSSEYGKFIFQPMSGDSVLTARIDAPNVNAAALIVRANTNSHYGRSVAVRFTNAAGGVQFSARLDDVAGGTRVTLPATPNSLSTPYWARITRSGNLFTGEVSPDGVTWTLIGQTSVAGMPTTVNWGFFQCVDGYSLQRAVFSDIAFSTLTAPAPPGQLSVERILPGVSLSWADDSNNETGFLIERGISGSGSFSALTTVGGGQTSYTDQTAEPGSSYDYQVRAVNGAGSSAPSNVATAGPLAIPNPPDELVWNPSTLSGVEISWSPSPGGLAAEYFIERMAEGSGVYTQVAAVGAGTLNWTDTTALSDTGYQYRIQSSNPAGSSPYSSTVSVATSPESSLVSMILPAISDAQISNGLGANATHGTEPSMVVAQGNGSGDLSNAYLRFDTSGRPSTSEVIGYELSTTSASNGGIGAAYLHLLDHTTDGWNESDLTWNNAVYTSANVFSSAENAYLGAGSFVLLNAGNSFSFIGGADDALVQRLNSSKDNGIVTLLLSHQLPGGSLTLASRENEDYDAPRLTLSLLQAPAARRATNLSGSVVGAGTVSLLWTDNSVDETGFRVEVSTDNGQTFTSLAVLPPNTTTLTTSAIPAIGGAQVYRVVAFNPDGEATPSLSFTLSPFTGFQAWLSVNGLPLDGTGSGSPTAAPAGDGIQNLVKYALGIAAGTPGYQGRYFSGIEAAEDGKTYLQVSYTVPEPAPEGVDIVVESGTDLLAASFSSSSTTPVSSSVAGGFRTTTVRDSIAIEDDPSRFLRIKFRVP